MQGIPESWGHRPRAQFRAPPTALSLLLRRSSMHEVFSEKGPLTCEMTLTQALGSGRSRHSQALGQTPPALRHLPLEREAVRNFLPFFRKTIRSHLAGADEDQLAGEGALGLGNLRVNAGSGLVELRRADTLPAGGSEDRMVPRLRTPTRAPEPPCLRAWWRRCKRG